MYADLFDSGDPLESYKLLQGISNRSLIADRALWSLSRKAAEPPAVADTGGVLSHCAIVAREYGIPAVLGTGRATAVLQDGQLLEVDGDAGEVRILE